MKTFLDYVARRKDVLRAAAPHPAEYAWRSPPQEGPQESMVSRALHAPQEAQAAFRLYNLHKAIEQRKMDQLNKAAAWLRMPAERKLNTLRATQEQFLSDLTFGLGPKVREAVESKLPAKYRTTAPTFADDPFERELKATSALGASLAHYGLGVPALGKALGGSLLARGGAFLAPGVIRGAVEKKPLKELLTSAGIDAAIFGLFQVPSIVRAINRARSPVGRTASYMREMYTRAATEDAVKSGMSKGAARRWGRKIGQQVYDTIIERLNKFGVPPFGRGVPKLTGTVKSPRFISPRTGAVRWPVGTPPAVKRWAQMVRTGRRAIAVQQLAKSNKLRGQVATTLLVIGADITTGSPEELTSAAVPIVGTKRGPQAQSVLSRRTARADSTPEEIRKLLPKGATFDRFPDGSLRIRRKAAWDGFRGIDIRIGDVGRAQLGAKRPYRQVHRGPFKARPGPVAVIKPIGESPVAVFLQTLRGVRGWIAAELSPAVAPILRPKRVSSEYVQGRVLAGGKLFTDWADLRQAVLESRGIDVGEHVSGNEGFGGDEAGRVKQRVKKHRDIRVQPLVGEPTRFGAAVEPEPLRIAKPEVEPTEVKPTPTPEQQAEIDKILAEPELGVGEEIKAPEEIKAEPTKELEPLPEEAAQLLKEILAGEVVVSPEIAEILDRAALAAGPTLEGEIPGSTSAIRGTEAPAGLTEEDFIKLRQYAIDETTLREDVPRLNANAQTLAELVEEPQVSGVPAPPVTEAVPSVEHIRTTEPTVSAEEAERLGLQEYRRKRLKVAERAEAPKPPSQKALPAPTEQLALPGVGPKTPIALPTAIPLGGPTVEKSLAEMTREEYDQARAAKRGLTVETDPDFRAKEPQNAQAFLQGDKIVRAPDAAVGSVTHELIHAELIRNLGGLIRVGSPEHTQIVKILKSLTGIRFYTGKKTAARRLGGKVPAHVFKVAGEAENAAVQAWIQSDVAKEKIRKEMPKLAAIIEQLDTSDLMPHKFAVRQRAAEPTAAPEAPKTWTRVGRGVSSWSTRAAAEAIIKRNTRPGRAWADTGLRYAARQLQDKSWAIFAREIPPGAPLEPAPNADIPTIGTLKDSELRRALTSFSNACQHLGPAGVELDRRICQAVADGAIYCGGLHVKLAGPVAEAAGDFRRLRKMAPLLAAYAAPDVYSTPATDKALANPETLRKVKAVYAELKTHIFDPIADSAEELGVEVYGKSGKLEPFAEHRMDLYWPTELTPKATEKRYLANPEVRNKAVAHLVEKGMTAEEAEAYLGLLRQRAGRQLRDSHINYSRKYTLPKKMYNQDPWKVLLTYIDATPLYLMKYKWGGKDQALIKPLLDQIALESETAAQAQWVQHHTQAFFLGESTFYPKRDRGFGWVGHVIANTFLGIIAPIKNILLGNVNALAPMGFRAWFKAFNEFTFHYRATVKDAMETGGLAALQHFLEAAYGSWATRLAPHLMGPSEHRIIRPFVTAMARVYVQDALKTLINPQRKISLDLIRMSKDPVRRAAATRRILKNQTRFTDAEIDAAIERGYWEEDELKRGIYWSVMRGQGGITKPQLPAWTTTKAARNFATFWKMAMISTGNAYKNVLVEARYGNFQPLFRWVAASLFTGTALEAIYYFGLKRERRYIHNAEFRWREGKKLRAAACVLWNLSLHGEMFALMSNAFQLGSSAAKPAIISAEETARQFAANVYKDALIPSAKQLVAGRGREAGATLTTFTWVSTEQATRTLIAAYRNIERVIDVHKKPEWVEYNNARLKAQHYLEWIGAKPKPTGEHDPKGPRAKYHRLLRDSMWQDEDQQIFAYNLALMAFQDPANTGGRQWTRSESRAAIKAALEYAGNRPLPFGTGWRARKEEKKYLAHLTPKHQQEVQRLNREYKARVRKTWRFMRANERVVDSPAQAADRIRNDPRLKKLDDEARKLQEPSW